MPRRVPSKMMSFRLPAPVAEAWRSRADASGVSLSDWLRSQIDAGQVTGIAPPGRRRRRNYTPADPDLLRQLAWIGNNLNQIARQVNSRASGIDAVQILAQLSALESHLPFLPPRKEQSDAQC